MKEIKESAFGTGCAQERSDNFCDFFYFCGTKEIKKGLLWSLPSAAKFLLFLLFLRDIETSAQQSAAQAAVIKIKSIQSVKSVVPQK